MIDSTLLYFNNGVLFSSPSSGPVPKYTFAATTDLADSIRVDPTFRQEESLLLSRPIRKRYWQISQHIRQFNQGRSGGSRTIPGPLWARRQLWTNFSHSFFLNRSHLEARQTCIVRLVVLGWLRLSAVLRAGPRRIRSKSELQAFPSRVPSTTYTSGTSTRRSIQTAKLQAIQAGFNTLGNGGNVYKIEVHLDTPLLVPNVNWNFQ